MKFYKPIIYAMKKAFFVICLLIFSLNVEAQDYWQQKVDYKIDVKLDDTKHKLNANQQIIYTNNSPNQLKEIYILLYANALSSKKTDFAEQQKKISTGGFMYFKEQDLGYIKVKNILVEGKKAKLFFEDTNKEVAKIILPEGIILKSNQKIKIDMSFELKFPKALSRLGHYGQSYQVTQWYPKVAVYDKYGWNLLHYLSVGEFYSDFGDYDVTITLPRNYVVAATGDLRTKTEMEWLMKRVENTKKDMKENYYQPYNFSINFPTSDSIYKTINYTQKNVVDFAWFADKRYYVMQGEVELPNSKRKVKTWSFFTQDFAKSFRKSIKYLDSAVFYYSKLIGDYPFNQVTAVTGPHKNEGGGMEYPTITIVSLQDYEGQIILHEVGHNWFQGILANNERRFPFMDEGINSYYDHRIAQSWFGKKDKYKPEKIGKDFYRVPFKKRGIFFDFDVTECIKNMIDAKNFDQPINLKSEDFLNMNYAIVVYEKTAKVLKHLENYLGKDKFDSIMKKYYQKWKFKHPFPQDLKNIFEKETNKDLNWFFDDILGTTRKVDYAITKIDEKIKKDSITVTLKNKRKIKPPVTLGYINKNEQYEYKWIEGFEGKKQFSLPRKEYQKIAVNANNSIFDINMQNNIKKNNIFKNYYTKHLYNITPQSLLFLPTIAYNVPDGFMAGMIFSNIYLPKRHWEYAVMPLYAFKSKKIAGMADVRFNMYPYSEKYNYKIQIGVKFKKFSYINRQNILGYHKIEPSISFNLKKRPLVNFNSHKIKFRTAFIQRNEKKYDRDIHQYKIKNKKYYINEIGYTFRNKKPLKNKDLSLKIQQNNDFAKMFAEFRMEVPYKLKGNKLDIRIFAGTFLKTTKQTDVNTLLRLGNQGFSAFKATQDYMCDFLYFDRAAQQGFAAQQIYTNNGNFKMANSIGRTDKWLVAINIKSSFIGRLPVKPFVDIGTYEGAGKNKITQKIAYNGGALFSLWSDRIEVYFPLFYSKDIEKYIKTNKIKYYKQIQIMINLNKYDIFEILDYLSDIF